jgi:hypothetical protein
MSRIRVEILGEGQHPSEALVAVKTANGTQENIIVDRRSIDNDTIEVGFPVGSDPARYLVELPRETVNGQWRLWMKREDVLDRVPA